MQFFADFHIHSKYSRATSQEMDLETLDKYAKAKGILLLGSGDFTHPEWFKDLKEGLVPAEPGLFRHKETRFILTTEVSCVFDSGGRRRKIHLIIFAPSFELVERINKALSKFGDLSADGRPILRISASSLVKLLLDISPDIFIVPAHIWTPWFSLFGANSGFDSIFEAFGEEERYIYALETGLSSDPRMNWRLSSLDRFTLISNSDSHSPIRIGRECNAFDTTLSYKDIIEAMKEKDKKGLKFTVEFFPEEGKYHYDGHRVCGVRFSPEETKKNNYICPVCKKRLTVGVMHRVVNLADREEGFVLENAVPFVYIIPLDEVIANATKRTSFSVAVLAEYWRLVRRLDGELNVLLNSPPEVLNEHTSKEIATCILNVRDKKVTVEPGYDGVYGKINISLSQREPVQMTLF